MEPSVSFQRLAPVLAVVALLGVGVVLAMGNEQFCTFWPSIDTQYAHGFSERNFAKVRPGMAAHEVERLLGQPLDRRRSRGGGPLYTAVGDEEWHYSQDGKLIIGDWAWLGRQVLFDKGRVVATASPIYRD